MLTGAQVATVAYETEDGELLSAREFDNGDTFARPVSLFELEERQSRDASFLELDELEDAGHVEACEYEPAIFSEGGDYAELLPEYHYKAQGCTYDDDDAKVKAREQELYGQL